MTHHVQEFIESTIDLIEKQEYHEVFTIWYVQYYDGSGLGKDYQNLQELFSVFNAADIDLYADSEEARKDIIAEHMYDYIDHVLSNDPDVSEITLPEVIKHLNSKLSISLIDLNNLFKEVSSSLSGRYDITRLPFKIQRNR
jgi:hypothetical protein